MIRGNESQTKNILRQAARNVGCSVQGQKSHEVNEKNTRALIRITSSKLYFIDYVCVAHYL